MTRHFLSLADAGGDAVAAMLADALDRKMARASFRKGQIDADAPLAGHVLAMIFENNSTRTRVSFDMSMRQLGGGAIVMAAEAMQLGRGETIADTARVLSRMVDAIMIRTSDHAKIEELAHYADIPVINGLTDLSHPCQIMADLLTIIERGKPLPGLQVAWLGDGNNVLYSLIEAAELMGFTVRAGCPNGFGPSGQYVSNAHSRGGCVLVTDDPIAAISAADVVITDTWVSMGQAAAAQKTRAMQPFRVDEMLMALAKPDAMFLHCLPAHRGEEVTEMVIDGTQSAVWDEAENRVHAQKSILRWVFSQL